MPAPDDGALNESQGVDAGVEQGPQPGADHGPTARPPTAPGVASGEVADDEAAHDAATARVEPDGTSQGGMLSRTSQHDGGPGQEYAVGEGG